MIPAVLTCVFVVWLYTSLNRDASSSAATGTGTNTTSAGQLADRLTQLEGRVRALAKSDGG